MGGASEVGGCELTNLAWLGEGMGVKLLKLFKKHERKGECFGGALPLWESQDLALIKTPDKC